MSETDENEPDQPVSMTKTPAARGGGRPAKVRVPDQPLPRSMQAVFGAMGLILVGSLLRAFAVHSGQTAALTKYVVYVNSKAKKPKKPYTAADIVHDIHQVRVGIVVNGLLLCVLVLGLMWGLRRARSAWASRWMTVLALVFLEAFLYVVPAKDMPSLVNVGGVLVGVGAIITLIGLFIPPSAKYIAECRELSLPPERRGQPRPKLFGPRSAGGGGFGGARGTAARGAAQRGVAARPPANRSSAPAAGKSKAKARSDAEAVARGAELARSRARASKSRRTDV